MSSMNDLTEIPPAIAAAAHRVARAEADLAEHRRVAGQARQAEQRIIDRIANLDARRAAIGARRADGELRHGDAGEVELIGLDRAELENMRVEAAEMADHTGTAEQQAEQAVAAARQQLARAEHATEEQELAAHAAALGLVLIETVKRMNECSKALGNHRAAWQPSEELKEKLRRLQFGTA